MGLLAAVVWVGRRGDERSAFILAIAAALALSPIVWLHYFALLLVVVALAQPTLGLVWFIPLAMVVTPGSGHPTPFETAATLAIAALTSRLRCGRRCRRRDRRRTAIRLIPRRAGGMTSPAVTQPAHGSDRTGSFVLGLGSGDRRGDGRMDACAVRPRPRRLRELPDRTLRPRQHGAGGLEHDPGTLLEMTDGSTGEQVVRLGGHVDPLLVLLAPLWMLWPSPLALAFAQIAVVALGALPVFWLARRHLGAERLAAVLAIAYLAYPWVATSAGGAIHPVTFAITLLLFACGSSTPTGSFRSRSARHSRCPQAS